MHRSVPGKFVGIVGQDPTDSKTSRLVTCLTSSGFAFISSYEVHPKLRNINFYNVTHSLIL